MWPYCKQPLYAFAMPLAFNLTVLNGMGVTGRFMGPPKFEAGDQGGLLLSLSFTHSDVLWPWSGFLGVYIEVGVAFAFCRGGWESLEDGWGGCAGGWMRVHCLCDRSVWQQGVST